MTDWKVVHIPTYILHIYNGDILLTFKFTDLAHVRAFVGTFQRHFILKDDLVFECNEIGSDFKCLNTWYM